MNTKAQLLLRWNEAKAEMQKGNLSIEFFVQFMQTNYAKALDTIDAKDKRIAELEGELLQASMDRDRAINKERLLYTTETSLMERVAELEAYNRNIIR